MENFLAQLKQKDIIVTLNGGDLKINFNRKIPLSKELISELKLKKQEIINYLKERENYNHILPAEEAENYPLSNSQKRLWIMSQVDEASRAYNMPYIKKIDGDYDIVHLKKAIKDLVGRHEILRTIYRKNNDGEIRQWILPSEEMTISFEYRTLVEEKSEQEVFNFIKEQSKTVFDLENGPLFKICFLQIRKGEYLLYFNVHHIISDGWSMKILARDLFAFYDFHKNKGELGLKELNIQYKDYAVWQNENLSGDRFTKDKEFWLHNLSGDLPVIDLPIQKRRPQSKTFSGGSLTTSLSRKTSERLREFCGNRQGTVFMGLLTILKILLYRYTSQKDIIIGTPVAGRDHKQLEDQIGFYVNSVALRNKLNDGDSFEETFNKIRKTTLTSFSHYSYPFDCIIEDLDLELDKGRNPIFDIMMVYENETEQEILKTTERKGVIESKDSVIVKFDLGFYLNDTNEGINLTVNYNTDLYDKETVSALVRHFRQLSDALLRDSSRKIGEYDYLDNKERRDLMINKNKTTVPYPKESSVLDLFEEQVKRSPDAKALLFETKSMTYKELDSISNRLASYLDHQFDFGKETLVGIKLKKSEWTIISMLAILKAGGAYLPIDADYPQERIDYFKKDSQCKFIIDERLVSDFKDNVDSYSKYYPRKQITSSHLAYVMYTSGSTGKPKGVMVEHISIVRLVKSANFYSFSSSDKLLSTGAFSFDATTMEYWGPLLNGGQLILSSKEKLLATEDLTNLIQKTNSNIMWFTAGWLHQLIDEKIELFGNLETIIAGGDRLSFDHIDTLRRTYPDLKIINGYGPTENTTFSLTHEIKNVDKNIPIGVPINNSTVFILDTHLNLVPVGVTGEIFLGGDGLSRGYLNRDDLTVEKFVPHPFVQGKRLYRTGDLGRWSSSGVVEFIGRSDDQVKIRGNRIELGEIESTIRQKQGILDISILVKDFDGVPELIAYYVAEDGLSISGLRDYIRQKLPEYMMPGHFVQLDCLPLTANGKVDRKNLLSLTIEDHATKEQVTPARNTTDEKLIAIWKEILKREHIGIEDDFFDLGGHSLKATKLISEYNKIFEVKLGLKDLYRNSKLWQHSELIVSTSKTEYIPIPKAPNSDNHPLSDAQRRLWVLSRFDEMSTAYNMPFKVSLKGIYDLKLFKKAIYSTIDRHEILRTIFKEDKNGEIRQWILNSDDINFKVNSWDYREKSIKEVDTYIDSDTMVPFNLESGPLLRVDLFQLGEEDFVCYYNMHHIISDGWSMQVLSNDVMAFYDAYKEDRPSNLKPLKVQYKDFTHWQIDRNKKEDKEQETYWLKKLNGLSEQSSLPGQRERTKKEVLTGKTVGAYLDPKLCQALKSFCNDNDGALFTGVLTVFNILFYKYTRQTDIVFGTPIAGREHIDLKNQIGCYLNTLVLRNDLHVDHNFKETFQRVQESLFDAYKYQSYPFDKLIEILNVPRNDDRNPLFDVMLSFHNQNNEGESMEVKDFGAIRELGNTSIKLDMLINFMEIEDFMYINIIYDDSLYSFNLIKNLIQNFKVLLKKLLDEPLLAINKVDYQADLVKTMKGRNLRMLKKIEIK